MLDGTEASVCTGDNATDKTLRGVFNHGVTESKTINMIEATATRPKLIQSEFFLNELAIYHLYGTSVLIRIHEYGHASMS